MKIKISEFYIFVDYADYFRSMKDSISDNRKYGA